MCVLRDKDAAAMVRANRDLIRQLSGIARLDGETQYDAINAALTAEIERRWPKGEAKRPAQLRSVPEPDDDMKF